MEQSVLERPDAERRFLLGRSLEALRTGSALLLRLSSTEAAQWLRLFRGLFFRPQGTEAQPAPAALALGDPQAQEFLSQLPKPAQQAVQQILEKLAVGAVLPPEDFLSAVPLLADRAGLLFCDDIAAAARVMARAQGEELAVVEGHGGGILLGQVAGGAELARYYLSDSYQDLTSALRDTSRL